MVVGVGVVALAVGVVLLTRGSHNPAAAARAAASLSGRPAAPVPTATDPALALGYLAGCTHPRPDTPPHPGTLWSARCADPAWIAPPARSGRTLAVRFYVFRDPPTADRWMDRVVRRFHDQGVVRGAGSPVQGGYPWAVDVPDGMPGRDAMAQHIAQRTGGRIV